MRISTSLLSCTGLLAAAVFAPLPGWTEAEASVISADAPNCGQSYTSARYGAVEQNQIFVVGNDRCSGRWTVHVTMEADGQYGGGKSELSVSIHPITARQGENVLQTGPDLCEGRSGAQDAKFNHTTVRCAVTRSLSPGNRSELSVHYFSNDTLNQRMETWWTYEPGL